VTSAPTTAIPTTVTDVPGFPYPGFDEFVAAVRQRRAFLAVDQAFAVQWMQWAVSRGGAPVALFHGFLAWAMVWVGVVAAVIAWGQMGLWALVLIPVSLIAASMSRPWRGSTPVALAFAVAVAGLVMNVPWLQWAGTTWVATYLVYRVMYADATRRFTEDLLHNEKQLAAALTPSPNAQAHIVTGEEIKSGGGDWRKGGH
jgi:hypothetical protein